VRARLIKNTRCPNCKKEIGRRYHRSEPCWRDWSLWLKLHHYLRVEWVFGIDNFDRLDKQSPMDSFDQSERFDLKKSPDKWLVHIEKICQAIETEYWARVLLREPADCSKEGIAVEQVAKPPPTNSYSELW